MHERAALALSLSLGACRLRLPPTSRQPCLPACLPACRRLQRPSRPHCPPAPTLHRLPAPHCTAPHRSHTAGHDGHSCGQQRRVCQHRLNHAVHTGKCGVGLHQALVRGAWCARGVCAAPAAAPVLCFACCCGCLLLLRRPLLAAAHWSTVLGGASVRPLGTDQGFPHLHPFTHPPTHTHSRLHAPTPPHPARPPCAGRPLR